MLELESGAGYRRSPAQLGDHCIPIKRTVLVSATFSP